MAENSFRSYRGGSDPFARGGAAPASTSREPTPDPLAELARLIGQNDPFADLGRNSDRTAAQPRYDDPQAGHGDWSSNGYATRDSDRREPDRYDTAPATDSQSQHYQAQQYPDDQLVERPFPGTAPRYDDSRAAAHPDDDYQDYDDRDPPQARDSAAYAAGPASEHGYDDEAYERQAHDEHDAADPDANHYQPDEFYDDAPRRRRRGGLVVVMAVLGLAVVGTAGAFAYRAMFGGAMLPSMPPIIKANGTPSKVVPAPAAAADAGKAAERVAAAGQSEQVVSREEQPVELKAATRSVAPRVISTIPVSPSAVTPALASPPPGAAPIPPAAAAPEAQPPGPGGAPKKIRTVTIRPDQVSGGGAIAPTPLAPSRSVAARPVAPRGVAPQPAAGPSGEGPLSLAPASGSSEAAPTSSRGRVRTSLARPSSPAEAEPSAPAAGGGYAVQVSSQRSEAEAHAAFKSLQSKFPGPLRGRSVSVRRADLGSKGVYYRAMVGPFASMDEAAGLCSSLKAAGGSCVVQRN